MRYPYEFTVEDYYDLDFDQRNDVDDWLKKQGIISEITKTITLLSPTVCRVEQYVVKEGKIERDDSWKHSAVTQTLTFKVDGNAFPV